MEGELGTHFEGIAFECLEPCRGIRCFIGVVVRNVCCRVLIQTRLVVRLSGVVTGW